MRGCKIGDGVIRMGFSQVGNWDIERACEGVDNQCLSGRVTCSLMEQCEKMSASYYQILLLVMCFCEFRNLEVIFLKVGQTLCAPDLPAQIT